MIVACLEPSQLRDLSQCANDIGLDVLVEIHDADELDEALKLNLDLLGINNRNLHDFSTDLGTTIRLLGEIPAGIQVVTESGIHSRQDILDLRAAGVHSFLIGEAFMRADDPGKALASMFNVPDRD